MQSKSGELSRECTAQYAADIQIRELSRGSCLGDETQDRHQRRGIMSNTPFDNGFYLLSSVRRSNDVPKSIWRDTGRGSLGPPDETD